MRRFLHGTRENEQSRGITQETRQRSFQYTEIYLDGVIVTKVSDESDAMEMVSRWQEIYK